MHSVTSNCAALAAAAILALAAIGCEVDSATDKAGGAGTPVTLRLATPGRQAIVRFPALPERFFTPSSR